MLRTEVADRIATVTLDRPEARNALNADLLRALPEVMAAADIDGDVDVIVLTGSDPAFCAGLDLGELGASGDMLRTGMTGRPWARTAKPVIGAVNGPAVTGGLEVALACDFLVASDRARFADTHARVGVLPGWGMTVLLPQAVGPRLAKEMSFTGRFVTAEEALRAGLVNHVVPHDELLPEARRIAQEVVTADGAAVRALLASYERVLAVTPERGAELELDAARAWNHERFTPEEVARRRAAVTERGRAQAGS